MGTARDIRMLRKRARQLAGDLDAGLEDIDAATNGAISSLSQSLASKADTNVVSALSNLVNGKADQSSLAVLAGMLPNKADVTALAALSQQLSGKADAASISSVLALKADQSAVASLASTVAGKADVSALPVPATAAPPSVGMANDKGSVVRFALENHTHKSNVLWKELTVGANGTAVWTFDTPFAATPYVIAQAFTPNGASYVNYASPVDELTNATSTTITVARIAKSVTLPSVLTALLGSVLTLIGAGSQNTKVHCIARLPA